MTFKANTKTKAKARVRFSRLLVFVDWLKVFISVYANVCVRHC